VFSETRALTTRACELGRIEYNGPKVKRPPATSRLGDLLKVTNESGNFVVEVLLLIEDDARPAAFARTLYRETATSQEPRLKLAEEHKSNTALRDAKPRGKPSSATAVNLIGVAESNRTGHATRASPSPPQPAAMGGRSVSEGDGRDPDNYHRESAKPWPA